MKNNLAIYRTPHLHQPIYIVILQIWRIQQYSARTQQILEKADVTVIEMIIISSCYFKIILKQNILIKSVLFIIFKMLTSVKSGLFENNRLDKKYTAFFALILSW